MSVRTRRILARFVPALLVGGLLAVTAGSLPLGAQPATKPAESVSVIVTLKEQATLAGITGATRRQRSENVIRTLQDKATSTQTGLKAFLDAQLRTGSVSEYTSFWVFNGLEVTGTPEAVAKLARLPEVLKITPNSTLAAPTEPTSGPPEANIALVRALELWALGYRGGGIVVASMDAGVDAGHPDLAAQWRGGTNSWFDPNGQHPTSPIDTSGHGTRTMGVIVGGSAGGTAVGMAPDAQWIAVKIFNDSGTAPFSGVHAGFQWLLDPDGNPATLDSPHVVNNSWTLGGSGCNLEFQLDLQALRAAEIVPVFAAGNYGPSASTSRSPANNPEAFAVGASTQADAIWTASSRGPSACADPDPIYPGLVAPGASIRTTDRFGGYVSVSGTSLAAPHASGAVALLLDAHPGTSSAALESALASSAVDLGTSGPDDTFGYGRLDAMAASEWLGAPPPDFDLVASPSSATTVAAGSVSYTVAVAARGGFASDVALSIAGLPTGADASFEPPVVAGGSGSSQLTVTTSESTPVGSHVLVVSGAGGSVSHSATVTLVVDPPPDFALSVSPPSASTQQGGTALYTTSVSSLYGFDGYVTLSVTGLPVGVTATFDPAVVVAAGTSQLTVTTSGTPPGSYPLTIGGSSGSLEHTAPVTLVVSPAQQASVPSSTTVLAGTHASGNASSLALQDASYYVVNSTAKGRRTSAWYGTMTTVPNGLTSLRVTYAGTNSRTCTQTVEIWSWASSSWVALDSRSVGTSEVLIADLTPGGALADYVSGSSGAGDVRVIVRCQTSGGSFASSGNLLKVTYTPP